ncbi:SACE_7040 family transcriptional regulator [Pseudarthrobacter niigatensis]|uniref:AcrR family transcriptional regulator n=1 Tax=Pseudarthrobacter niigatensis TaxID=369935 RepID=A0AAJ1ST48_9MICC|nr:TetR family transcriptional regulator [Pseudarthrobacter niigatensis]MDQ0146371.1 AcrR family transcriptional regulator [Pseudarthrobacter niigatensis]MDQ0264921.1 AcrR family transcriptional regulator [Pseudarthrobacter niigatensis]
MSSNTAQPAPAAQAPAAQAPTTQRGKAKENRRQALLSAAASLFAANGFNRVSLEDLGAAAGVSGPAVYRHFSGKQAVLAGLLVTVSQELLDGGRQVVERTADPMAALRQLVEFQVNFALGKPDVIRVQDRDLPNLSEQDQLAVRTLQRSYVEIWVDVLARIHPDTDVSDLRMRAHATFGLINSTPHSVRSHGRRMASRTARPLLEAMAMAALTVPSA